MGHHGRLPELSEDYVDSAIATSLMESTLRRKVAPPTPYKLEVKADVEQDVEDEVSLALTTPHKLEVKADVEPDVDDEVSLADTSQPSFGSDQESTGRRLSEQEFFLQSISDQGSPGWTRIYDSSHPSKQQTIQEEESDDSLLSLTIPDDQVVSEDGKYIQWNL